MRIAPMALQLRHSPWTQALASVCLVLGVWTAGVKAAQRADRPRPAAPVVAAASPLPGVLP